VKLAHEELVDAIAKATGGEAAPELAAAIAEDCGRTVDWLATHGAQFTSASPISWHRWTLGPPRAPVAGQDWRGRGPDRMLGQMRQRLEERQGRMFLGSRALGLQLRNGRCIGFAACRGGAQKLTRDCESGPPERHNIRHRVALKRPLDDGGQFAHPIRLFQ
jgi:succinate dehydrogenase/fumarate reductase flavoprotein subunit